VPVESSEAIDVELLQRIVARDPTAVAALYDRHSTVAFAIIMRILRNRADAEEVVQEVFVRVWTRATTYDERLGTPAAWLIRMARNRAIDRLRARRTRGDIDGAEPPAAAVPERAASAAASPEALAEWRERTDSIRGALGALPPEQRDLIAAAFFEGYTHSELAARFQLPLGTVKTRIRAGMLAMREHLEHAV
jgi:RNA polymerase sigma-70 factor, ECF subfamily